MVQANTLASCAYSLLALVAVDKGIQASSVVTVAGICNSVGGGVLLTCHRCAGGSGEYWSVSRLGLLTGNRWMSRLQDQIFLAGWNALIAHSMLSDGLTKYSA